MAYRIFTDACCDLPHAYADAHGITILSMGVTVGGDEFVVSGKANNPKGIDIYDFYARLRKGETAKTSQVNREACIEGFEPVLRAGDDIICISFSSELSGTYNNCALAGKELQEKYPERKIIVIDTLCASLGEGMVCMMAARKAEEGMGIDELAEYVREISPKVHHWVTVDDLAHLKRGGRVSGAVALFGTMLSIKPIIMVDEGGKLPAVDKVQGRKRSLKYLVDRMEEEVERPITSPITLAHSDCLADAQIIVDMIKERMGADVEIVNIMSPIIGSHTGPGTLALFYISDKPRAHK